MGNLKRIKSWIANPNEYTRRKPLKWYSLMYLKGRPRRARRLNTGFKLITPRVRISKIIAYIGNLDKLKIPFGTTDAIRNIKVTLYKVSNINFLKTKSKSINTW